jgi:hypothetical protein
VARTPAGRAHPPSRDSREVELPVVIDRECLLESCAAAGGRRNGTRLGLRSKSS